MLLIHPKNEKIPFTHEESGAAFVLRPLLPADRARLMRESTDEGGRFDFVKYNGLVADFAILSWEGVGDNGQAIACTKENKLAFGENLAEIVMPDLLKRVQEKGEFIELEIGAAKNA